MNTIISYDIFQNDNIDNKSLHILFAVATHYTEEFRKKGGYSLPSRSCI